MINCSRLQEFMEDDRCYLISQMPWDQPLTREKLLLLSGDGFGKSIWTVWASLTQIWFLNPQVLLYKSSDWKLITTIINKYKKSKKLMKAHLPPWLWKTQCHAHSWTLLSGIINSKSHPEYNHLYFLFVNNLNSVLRRNQLLIHSCGTFLFL